MMICENGIEREIGLREVVEHFDVSGLPYLTEIKRLYEENEALRGIAEDVAPIVAANAFRCWGCRYDEHEECSHRSECRLTRRMRALGIEVE